MTGRGPTDRALRWLGVLVWVGTVALTVVAFGLRLMSHAPPYENRFGMTDASLGGFGILEVTCVSVALVIISRLPRNLVAWLLFGIGLSYAISIVCAAIVFDAAADGTLADRAIVAWLAQAGAQVAGVLTFVFIFVYPEIHLDERKRLTVGVVVFGGTVIGVGSIALHPGSLFFWPSIPNPFGIGPRFLLGPDESLVAVPVILLAFGLAAVAWIGWRYRRSQGVERLQLKWFVSAAVVSLAALVVLITLGGAGRGTGTEWWPLLVYALSVTLVPIAVGVAILRYDLYAIDRIINRAIVYAAVTALLALVFAAIVVVVGAALAGVTNEYETVAVAISTLAVAALFSPIRGRIQRAVDRRFYRAKYDSTRTVDAFGERLRRTLDLEELEGEMLDVVERALRPRAAGVWLAGAEPAEGQRQAVRA